MTGPACAPVTPETAGGGRAPACADGVWTYDLPATGSPDPVRRSETHWDGPNGPARYGEGDAVTYDADVAADLGAASATDTDWHVLYQLHGPVGDAWPGPALTLNVRGGTLNVSGGTGHPGQDYTTRDYSWTRPLVPWVNGRTYRVRLVTVLSADPEKGTVSAWVDGVNVVDQYRPEGAGGPSLRPGTLYPGQAWVESRSGLYRGSQGGPAPTYGQRATVRMYTSGTAPSAPTATPPAAAATGTADHPFAATSIWNRTIPTDARMTPLNLDPAAQGYGVDVAHIVLDAAAPLRELRQRETAWPYGSTLGEATGVRVRVPDGWTLAAPGKGEQPNRGGAAYGDDGKPREYQYVVRPDPSGDLSIADAPRAVTDLAGDGLTGPGRFGAHGGSGMTVLGGTIREGELTGDAPIGHALAVTANMRKHGAPGGAGFRWPAIAADSYHAGPEGYGTLGQAREGYVMGSLLALPATVDVPALGLETGQGRKVADAYQTRGAYIVDDSFDPGGWDVHSLNVDAAALAESPDVDARPGSPFARDMDRIMPLLAVVTQDR